MSTPNGTKRTVGFVLMLLPVVLPFFGYRLSDVAPVQMALLVEPISVIVGALVMIYGVVKAKGKMWFVKK